MDMNLISQNHPQNNEDRIFSILFNEDELTWQTIIYDLVKSEEMDPWDVNVSLIAEKFLKMLAKMQEMDFRIGGKMVLAAALLLKIKSEKLVKEDMLILDSLLNSSEDEMDFLDELEDTNALGRVRMEGVELVPRTPQPRQRKVSVFDLVEALEKALKIETKKQLRKKPASAPEVKLPEKKKDMGSLITQMYTTVRTKLSKRKTISFSSLLPSEGREDKVFTFIPLLHLDAQRKVDLLQKEHFGPIDIRINTFAISQGE